MKKIVLIKPHSFVDVITNSSTELFVGGTEKDVSAIYEILQECLNSYNGGDFQSIQSICDVEIITDGNIDSWLATFNGWGLPYWICTETKQPEYDDFNNWEEYQQANDNWLERNRDIIKNGLIGMVTIMGSGDNEIPYDLFNEIENIFEKNSHRIHMG